MNQEWQLVVLSRISWWWRENNRDVVAVVVVVEENNRNVVVVEGNNRNVVAVEVVLVEEEGKQWKCGGGGWKTIEMWCWRWWRWWWWWRRRKTIEFYGLKTYINAQHSTSFSVYILLLRS